MPQSTAKGTTAVLAAWAAGFKLEHAPDVVVDRMKTLVLDLLRVVTPSASVIFLPAVRDRMSVVPPGVNGTISRIDLEG